MLLCADVLLALSLVRLVVALVVIDVVCIEAEVLVATAVWFKKRTRGVTGHGRNCTDRFVRSAQSAPPIKSGMAIASRGVEMFGKEEAKEFALTRPPAALKVQLSMYAEDEVPSTL